jgi:hypothetical protein
MKKMLRRFFGLKLSFGIIALVVSLAGPAGAKDVELAWDRNPETNLAGYKLYYRESTQSSYKAIGAYEGASPVDVGNAISKWLTRLGDAKSYCFAVTAYTTSGQESGYSNEVCATATPVAAPIAAIEAESGSLASPMRRVSDTAASGGSYIETTQVNAGSATFTFNVDTAGTYKIVARVFAANAGSDSITVNIDNRGDLIWDLNPSGSTSEFNVWREDDVTNRGTGTFDKPQHDPYTLNLTQGSHTITFKGREPYARLDYFRLVRVEDLPTSPDNSGDTSSGDTSSGDTVSEGTDGTQTGKGRLKSPKIRRLN